MSRPIAIAHSLPDSDALALIVAADYDLPLPVSCTLTSPGVNDTYRITTEGRTFFYRIYRAGWRTAADIQYELELLLHLRRVGVPVSVPVPKPDGSYVTALALAEGVRPAVLFTEAEGQVLAYTAADAFEYGCAAGRLHNGMDSFRSDLPRVAVNLETLLEQPLRLIRPFAERLGRWAFFADAGDRLRARVHRVEPLLEQGICHGDLHGHNVHKTKDGGLTLFDFDCGGPGYRAYDLACYRWAVSRHAPNAEPWDAFLRGYRMERPVAQVDLDAVPVFVAIRTLWLLGLQAGWVKQRGTESVAMWLQGGGEALRQWMDAELKE